MIHWVPLPLEFLVRMAPLPSAGKWLPNFAVFRKLVLPLHTHFSAIEVAGHIVVILEVFMKSLFTHRLMLHFFSLASIFRLGQVVANSYTVHCFLFVFAFWWQGLQWSPLRLQGVLGQLVVADAPGHLASASWNDVNPQGRTKKHTNTPPATVICRLHA